MLFRSLPSAADRGNSDILIGHTTWDDYSKMTRIFKYYNFPLGPETMATSIAMPSYPGALSSNDDYYVMNSGLVLMDTSLPQLVINPYDDVKSGPVTGDIPTWMHMMITNRLSKRAADWAGEYIKRNNIGTYNNQFIIGLQPLHSRTYAAGQHDHDRGDNPRQNACSRRHPNGGQAGLLGVLQPAILQ